MRVHDREPIGQALRRFKKLLVRSGMMWDLRRAKKFFVDPTQIRRKKRFQKRFKARKATLLAKQVGEQSVDSLKEATAAFWKRTGKP